MKNKRIYITLGGLFAIALSLGWFSVTLFGGPPVVIPADPDTLTQIRFIAVGDAGSGQLDQHRVARAMSSAIAAKGGADFVVLLGDNFYGHGVQSLNDPQWRYKFENLYTGRYMDALPFYAVLGNHDYAGNVQAQIGYTWFQGGSNRWRMPQANYSKDFGHTSGRPLLRIVFLDTNGSARAIMQQADFLKREMNRSPRPLWRIVVGHHPVRSVARHGESETLVAHLLPALQEVAADLYIAGHDHNLQLLNVPEEPSYVVAGGGGKSIYPIAEVNAALLFGQETLGFSLLELSQQELRIEFYDVSARLLSSFTRRAACLHSGCMQPSPGHAPDRLADAPSVP